MGNLLLVLSHADTAVKAMLCYPDTLRVLFVAIDYSGETLQLMTLRCIKNLSTDPSMLDPLKVALPPSHDLGSLESCLLKEPMPRHVLFSRHSAPFTSYLHTTFMSPHHVLNLFVPCSHSQTSLSSVRCMQVPLPLDIMCQMPQVFNMQ